VLNILGNESRIVTPVSHSYSGGNIVFGTSPGRQGQVLETGTGDIPIFDNVREGMKAGHSFNVGAVYLPPQAVRDGVAELVRVNPDVRKIIILTEKVPVRAAREIRAICQAGTVDVFGANCLGVADAWNHIRIGGALGGDAPQEVLKKGPIAIFSNSGNFTNTIATYLSMSGWGTTTLISSGKDVYIHYGAAEFAHGLSNDARSKAAVMYIEPGGYYEQGLSFDKPVVAFVVGHWKTNISRVVGHAGALAGSGDSAAAKEGWLFDSLGIDAVFTPENPVLTRRGAVVNDIAHIPLELSMVMAKNDTAPGFPATGTLELKPWFANRQGVDLPEALEFPVVAAREPYCGQIEAAQNHVGASFVRESMKDRSGASRMDPSTQITRIYGETVLAASRQSVEANIGRMLTKGRTSRNQTEIVSLVLAQAALHDNGPVLEMARLSQRVGNSPNTVMASVCGLVGPGCCHINFCINIDR